jgi:glutamate N-acetyltransferase/amino-acid N-acetyltransferase
LICEKATPSFAAVLTRNQVAGAPIIVARRRLAESTLLSGVVVNNRVANVVAPNGVSDAERVCEAAAKALGVYSGEGMISLSTGVVGWPLPVDAMVENMPALAESVKANKLDALDAAASIMTTDQWPKVRRAALPGGASVVGIAKGAGMVEPNMATMLSVLLTDARVSRSTLQRALERAVNAPGSFNSCSVDSDTSTSDAVVVLASNMQGVRFVDNTASNADESAVGDEDESSGVADSVDTLAAALTEVCRGLAEDVVRNGEGVSHVLRVRVANAPTDELAHAVGKAIVNSPLIKCAVAADDANIGRVAMAIGKAAMHHNVALTLSQVRIAIGGLTVLEQGALIASPELDTRLQQHMAKARMSFEAPPPVRWPVHNGCVEIDVDLGTQGSGSAEIIGADLTHEYVSINADYRT